MNKAIFVAAFILFASLSGAVRGQTQDAAGQDEVQVLIDVSGSMKQSDPKNLRVEAGKLLINLLAEHSKAALWLFAEQTALLTASDSVDAAWKQQATKAAARIHSQGLYTDIEGAVKTVLEQGFKGDGRKHLLILTDGVVDISKDIMVSADSRERILSEWIPELQRRGIQVETIALSDGADKELLDKLAFDTGGWAENAESAEQLQRAFLKMMQKAAPKDTLPLNDNQFAVDAGVKEFSLLVFKKPASPPSRLLTPEQAPISKQSTAANVSWLETSAYDLVTVKNPSAGNWRLEAETDPDNQVMIVTDLKMVLDELPNFVAENQAVTLTLHFTDHAQNIERADFLKMITMTVAVDQQVPIEMPPASKAGFFERRFEGLTAGKHHFRILADGKTFKREIDREIEVFAMPIAVETQVFAEPRQVLLKLIPDPSVIDATTLAIGAAVSRAGKAVENLALTGKDGVWQVKLDDLPPGSETTVNFNAMAKTPAGDAMSPAIPPLKIDDEFFRSRAVTPVAETEKASEPVAAGDEHANDAQTETETEAAPPAESANWWWVGGTVLGVNLLLCVAGFFIYRAMKKANAEKQQQLLGRLA